MIQEEVIKKIDKYLASDLHRPIIVDAPTINALKSITSHYNTGKNKIIQTKRYCDEDGMPLMDRMKNDLSKSEDIIFLDGLYFYLFLRDDLLKSELRSILDLSINNKLIILTLGCSKWVKDFDRRLFDSSRIILQDGEPEELPTLYFWSKEIVPPDIRINGLGDLSQMSTFLETGQKEIPVVTDKKKSDYPHSLYSITEFSSDYQTLSSTYEDVENLGAIAGTRDQWKALRDHLSQYDTLGDYIVQLFGSTNSLANIINGFGRFDSYKQWMYYIALRINGAKGNDYLSKVISRSRTYEDFIINSFCVILQYEPEEKTFNDLYKQRKLIVGQMTNYPDALDSFCKQLYLKKEKSIKYLTDNTQREKEMTIELLSQFASRYTQTELISILAFTYPDLATYLQPFDFNIDYLSKYFHLYKWCKITNMITPELQEMVDKQASERKYNLWLRPRSTYVAQMSKDKEKHILFFMDALGVEYLGYIQSKCFENGLNFHADIARCNLPSITSKNKEFVEEFKAKGCKIYDNKELDTLKHEGNSTYNYENNKLPIHIVEELNILNKLINQLKTIEVGQIAYVIADHGATRLAVINENENKWEVSEKGIHSGRCCPKSDIEEKPDFATEENDFWCLANYDRFKGGRAASVETHGGATLEEVAVPIISINKTNEKIVCKLVDEKPVIASFKRTAVLKLFVAAKSDKIAITVNFKTYLAQPTDTQYEYSVEMPDIKNAGIYTFNVLLDNMLIAKDLTFEVKKEGASERKFF